MKFDGIDPRTLHPGISIADEIPPGTVTSQLETLSGSDGEIIAGRTIQQGEYIVRINIAGKYKAEGWHIRQLIAGWARAADIVTHKLIPTHWPTVYYDAILKEISPPEFTKGFAVIDVVFTIPRPIAAALNESSVSGATPLQVKIGGTTWTKPAIGLTMKTATGVELKVDGETLLAIDGQYSSNDFVIVNTDPPMVQLMDGSEPKTINDRVDYTRTDFEALCEAFSPGQHTLTAESASNASVVWRDNWL